MAAGSPTCCRPRTSIWCGEELQRRFGLKYWQFTLTATDANRFAIRLARMVTGRPRIAVHDFCYHGSVDETIATLDPAGRVVEREGNVGPPVDPAITTRVVPYNDLPALEAALAHRDVAVLLIEPALTNIGIVLPEPGYLEGVRELTRRYGTLLIIDETHTICAGPGGYTRAFGLDPDILVIGKTIGGGIPVGTYGFSRELGDRINVDARGRQLGCRRCRRDPGRLCPVAGRCPGDPRRGPDRGRLRADDPPGRTLGRRASMARSGNATCPGT